MTILDRIVADTRALVAERKTATPAGVLREQAERRGPARSFEQALRAGGISVIAEIKKASPSKGLIREDFDPETIARRYARGGAAALSVLTEPLHFQGHPDHLRAARAAVSLPVLRKDFIVDPYQLLEARAWGADAVLLIAAVLDRHQLADLHDAAADLGLACLVEVYDEAELEWIDFGRVRVLGVNNRDLRTFTVDVGHSIRIFERVPEHVVRVSESGLRTGADLARLRRRGIDAVLIGETFMRAPDPGRKLAELLAEAEQAASTAHEPERTT